MTIMNPSSLFRCTVQLGVDLKSKQIAVLRSQTFFESLVFVDRSNCHKEEIHVHLKFRFHVIIVTGSLGL
jgi:hypothetical protein